jgi:poly-gamma-glutamate synthesis protein (capsule biosynthesis protein)
MAVNAPMEFRYDLNKNNIPETYSLENNIVTITENGKQLWQTPEDWHIDDVIIADSNNDGIIEINLLLWKSGNYGSSQPFWIKTNDDSIKNHFFLYTLENDQIKSVWQSSNLDKPNCSAQIKDVDHDGKNELVVLEGEYTEPYKCEPKYKSVWKWSEWGFYLDDRLDY